MKIPQSVQRELETSLGSPLLSASPLTGGSINQVFHITLKSKKEFVLKFNLQAPDDFFLGEASGLRLLAKHNIRVPEVVLLHDAHSDGSPFIVLDYFSPGSETVEHREELGRMLAQLHSKEVDMYGLEKDNFIGTLQQINTPVRSTELCSWGEFFIENRLRIQADLGQQNGWFNRDFLSLFLDKEALIQKHLDSVEIAPSLLHGDLWSGNIHWSQQGPVLIDPAVSYGNREMDLAFLELFGDPGESFRGAYREILVIEDGFEVRKHIHNLYYIMVHANLFGGEYVNTVWRILNVL